MANKKRRVLAQWIEKFDRHLEGLNYSSMTRVQYKHRLGLFAIWLRETHRIEHAEEVSPAHVGQYQAWQIETYRKPKGGRLSTTTQILRLVPIKVFFRWMYERGILPKHVAQDLQLPVKARTLPRDVATVREIGSVLRRILRSDSTLRLRNAAIIATLFATGCRKMELARLRIRDVDLQNREVRIEQAKNRYGRLSFIAPWAATLLRAYIRQERAQAPPDAPLFVSANTGSFLCAGRLRVLLWEAFCHFRAKRITAHSLRHAFCISLLRGGASIRVVAELAGHRCLSSSAIYTRLSLQDLRKVHEHAFREDAS